MTDYGATGNGSTDDTAAIQAAINGATGTLVFPAGEYRLTNKLQAKTGLNLVFEEGSRLIQYGNAAILDFSGVTDVTITGPVLHHTGSVSPGGPSVIHSDGTMARVSFYDVTIERCDGWCFRLRGDDLLLDGYVNTNRTYQTSNVDDGLTVAGKRITVRNFDIATNDDAISVKVFTGGETQNVLIENGTIRSRDGGLTFGSEIRGPLHDVTVRGVHFDDVKVPLYFKMLEATSSGHVTNVLIENITSEGNALWRLLHFHTVGGRENTAHDNTIRNAHHTGDVLHQCILVQNQPGNTLEDVICN